MINFCSQRCESKGGIVSADIGFELQTVWARTVEEMPKFQRWSRKGREIDLASETTHSKLWDIPRRFSQFLYIKMKGSTKWTGYGHWSQGVSSIWFPISRPAPRCSISP